MRVVYVKFHQCDVKMYLYKTEESLVAGELIRVDNGDKAYCMCDSFDIDESDTASFNLLKRWSHAFPNITGSIVGRYEYVPFISKSTKDSTVDSGYAE